MRQAARAPDTRSEALKYRLGVDVGGTFTDLVVADDGGRLIGLYKAATTPSDPVQGVINVLTKAAQAAVIPLTELLRSCRIFVHGTTIATNTLLTGSGSKTALITTVGFRDSLAIRRGKRDNIWDIRTPFPEPLVPRYLRVGITERVDKHGYLDTALNEEEVNTAIGYFNSLQVESVAVSLFNAFLNGQNERRVHELIAQQSSYLHVSISSEVLPVMGEYERTSTTVVDAYIAPRVSSYLEKLESRLQELGLMVPVLVTTNNGGVMRASFCRRQPVMMVLSGPAAGYPAANLYSEVIGARQVVLLDMGGTSSDVTLIVDGKAQQTDRTTIAGYDISIRTVDVRTIGTGGGSIARVDSGGLIRVGPEGAGADPGPACYQWGGVRPTVTDAHLVLDRLNPLYFLGGELVLSEFAAREAIKRDLAGNTDLSIEEAAYAIIRIATQNMADAIRLSALERGIDPRAYTLIAAGGAAGLHAAEVARDLRMSQVLVPRLAAGLCALGMLQADIVHDYVEAMFHRWEPEILPTLTARLAKLVERGARDLQEEGFPREGVCFEPSIDLRYLGQQWEIEVPLRNLESPGCITDVENYFHVLHESLYGHRNVGSPLECIQVRLRAIGSSAKLRLSSAAAGRPPPPSAHRLVFLDQRMNSVLIPIYGGEILSRSTQITGPALIEEATTTVFVPPEWMLSVTATGDYLLEFLGSMAD